MLGRGPLEVVPPVSIGVLAAAAPTTASGWGQAAVIMSLDVATAFVCLRPMHVADELHARAGPPLAKQRRCRESWWARG